MNLERILAISGKPGLYSLIAQSKGGVIVESITDKKRFPVSQANNVSSLKDIAIYTYGEEVPLADVFKKIYEKEDGGAAIDHKASANELRSYMEEVLPDYDQERVYNSDLKKLFSWYNLLLKEDMISLEEENEEEESEKEPDAVEEGKDAAADKAQD